MNWQSVKKLIIKVSINYHEHKYYDLITITLAIYPCESILDDETYLYCTLPSGLQEAVE